MWRTEASSKGSPATQACNLILSVLGGLAEASQYTLSDSCAGAGGPTPLLEASMNQRLKTADLKPVNFVLTDLWPDLKSWRAIAK